MTFEKKITDFLSGTYVLEDTQSPINGRIQVIRSLVFGTYIQIGGLTQSGGILYGVWKKPLIKIKNQNFNTKKCLILGLGGGTVAKIVRKFWPESEIKGVEIDPYMIKFGKKYLNLENWNVNIMQKDAFKYSQKLAKRKERFDLILIDIYVGREIPVVFESDEFIRNIKKLLGNNCKVIFNRLYYGDKRPESIKFGNKLEKFFTKVEVVYPEANIMFLCS